MLRVPRPNRQRRCASSASSFLVEGSRGSFAFMRSLPAVPSVSSVAGFLVALALLIPLLAPPLLSAGPPAQSANASTHPADWTEADGWLQGYLRIDTTNPPGGEHQGAAYLARILFREGITHRRLVTPEGRTSLYARLPATVPEPAGGALLLMHHIDVVPAEGEWQVPPFAGVVQDGYLWGRGAVDAKSLGIAHLAALIDLKRSGVPRQRDVLFLAVADEENGGGRGTAWLLQEHGDLFSDVEVVLNEGGGNRTVNGRTVWWGVEVAQKRPLWLRLSTRGRGGHGSGFNPQSAAHRLIAALDRLVSLPLQYRVTPAVRQYLGAIAPLHNKRIRRLFEDLDASVTESGLSELFAPGMAGLFLDTVQVTVLAGSARINSVTEVATAEVDIRLLPDTDGDAFLRRVQEALGSDVEVEVLLRFPPTPTTAAEGGMYGVLHSILEAEGQGPVVPTFISGFTDSRFFRHRGIAAYGVSPFTLEPQDLMGIHGKNEKILLREFNNGTERMKRIIGVYISKLPAAD